jgi:hypothetical protein
MPLFEPPVAAEYHVVRLRAKAIKSIVADCWLTQSDMD